MFYPNLSSDFRSVLSPSLGSNNEDAGWVLAEMVFTLQNCISHLRLSFSFLVFYVLFFSIAGVDGGRGALSHAIPAVSAAGRAVLPERTAAAEVHYFAL